MEKVAEDGDRYRAPFPAAGFREAIEMRSLLGRSVHTMNRMNPNDSSVVLLLCRDLMFMSKVTAAAQAQGVPVKVLRDPSKLAESADAHRLIVDLSQPGFLDAAAEWKAAHPDRHVTGFINHTDTETIARAKSAGLDRVLPRSAFVANLERIILTE